MQPAFRSAPHDLGRRFVNRFLGLMTQPPGGPKLVDLLGHMKPSKSLSTKFCAQALSGRLVLAPTVDPEGIAARAFSRFGFGALTLGPVGDVSQKPVFRQDSSTVLSSSGGATLSLGEAREALNKPGVAPRFVELLLDLESDDVLETFRKCLDELSAETFVLSPQGLELGVEANRELLTQLAAEKGQEVAFLIGLPERGLEDEELLAWSELCSELGFGIMLSGYRGEQGQWCWGDSFEQTLESVKAIRESYPELPLVADGGVLEPAEALQLFESGADLVSLSVGLVLTGPGLPKRINEALSQPCPPPPSVVEEPVERMAWFWGALLGLSMLFGAGLAGWVALTDVVLPYDEEFCGKTAAEIAAFNPKILSFMTHDRVTLSGTMVSVGILYLALSWFEIRRGSHWAQRVIQASSGLGFLSFFSFLGFGYFDPFHAMVAAILFQMLVQVMVRPAGPMSRSNCVPQHHNDSEWRRGLWGQLLFVVHGSALILAGIVILIYGMTVVFVPQDIAYMGTEVTAIEAFDAQLKALIAHDRATFGGMLVSAGVALLFTTMWGFRRGDSWLWWTYLVVIAVPYIQTLWIHRKIGYWDHFHLLPVYIGLVLLVLGLFFSRGHLCAKAESF